MTTATLSNMTAAEQARAVLEGMKARRGALLREIDRYALQAVEQGGEVPDPAALVREWSEIGLLARWIEVLEPRLRQLEHRERQAARWAGERRRDEALAARKREDERMTERAVTFLRDFLGDRIAPAPEVERAAAAKGIDSVFIAAAVRETGCIVSREKRPGTGTLTWDLDHYSYSQPPGNYVAVE